MNSKDKNTVHKSLVDTKNYILESYNNSHNLQLFSSSLSQYDSEIKRFSSLTLQNTSNDAVQNKFIYQSNEFTSTGKRKLNTYETCSSKNRFLQIDQNVTNSLLTSREIGDVKNYFISKPVSLKRSLSELDENGQNFISKKDNSAEIYNTNESNYKMPRYEFLPLNFENIAKDEFIKEEKLVFSSEEKEEKTLKVMFLTLVSTSLLYSPKFHDCKDMFRQLLLKKAEEVANQYPEFILKVALYTRQELNIRTTANFLLAYASFHKNCRPFLKRYFKESICLPTDWMEVAEIYKTLSEKGLSLLPAALRKAMVDTFEKFDQYQLAKYNRNKNKKKKMNKNESMKVSFNLKIVQDETEHNIVKQMYTLKKLIRLLHITKPVEHVMSLLGKKYPSDLETFKKSNLPGVWDESKAGKRMKLPIPETWETQLSSKGNKASVWQSLLDNKKLPYMAMLRNIRNLIIVGISKNHHNQVLKTISSEKAVMKSRQFPLRFFAAYQVIEELQSLLESNKQKFEKPATYLIPKKQPLPKWKEKLENKIKQRLKNFDENLLKQYKCAIDTAVEIAACHNIDPIQGRTLIICDVLSCFDYECPPLNGSLANKMHYGCLMMSLMISYACEEYDLKVITNDNIWYTPNISENKILDNIFTLMDDFNINFTKEEAENTVTKFYNERFFNLLEYYLSPIIAEDIQFDNIVFLTSGNNFNSTFGPKILKDFLNKYRILVNRNLLYVEVDLTGNQNSFNENKQFEHPNNVFLHGFSDQLLRFIAERGNGGQLNYVENIDKKYSLKSMPKPRPPIEDANKTSNQISHSKIQKWKTIRIFISSTFKDMHGERDLIVRYVIPELKYRAKTLNINIQVIDLRWGITEVESNNSKSLEICLSEVARCEYFLGILGERYGYISDYIVPNNPEFDWVKEYPPGASLTEMEIYCAALANPSASMERSFFYFRNKLFESQIPEKWKKDFLSESESSHNKIKNLKQRIKESGLEVFNDYPCYWGGEVNGIPVVAGLEDFGQRVLDNLWNSLCKYYKKEKISLHDHNLLILHSSYAETFQQITGRDSFVKNCADNILSKDGFFIITGKSGCGKTAIMAELCKITKLQPVFPYFIGMDSRSLYLHNMLYDLFISICSYFSIKYLVPNKLENLISIFIDILEAAVQKSVCGRLIIFIDGLDQLMDNFSQELDWLPDALPMGVKIILSTATNSSIYDILMQRSKYQKNIYNFDLSPLIISEREKIVCNELHPFRKTLDTSPFNNQLFMLISRREAGLPLFLHLACEELKTFGQFENLTSKLRNYPQTIYLLLIEILKQLDNIHGKHLVHLALCLISLSPEGLDEHELHTLLSVPNHILNNNSSFEKMLEVMQNLKPEDIFTPLKFSALLRSLYGFLQLTEDMKNTLMIKHSDFHKAINDHYNIGKGNLILTFHKLLGAYFYNEVIYISQWINISARSLRLLLYYLNASGQFNELSLLLCTIEFLKTSVENGIGLEVLNYYETLKNNSQEKSLHLKKIKDYYSFYSHNLHILESYPGLIYQQALNEPSDSFVFQDVLGFKHSNVIRWLTKPKLQSFCYLTLSNLKEAVTSIAISQDGNKAAFGKNDGTVLLVNSLTGKLIRTFTGHKQTVCCLCFIGNEKLCSASVDTTMSLWHIDKGYRLFILKGHSRRVSSCCATPCGKSLISVGWDNSLRVWNVTNGREISSITNIKSPLTCVVHHPDMLLVITGGWDKKIKIWDILTMTRSAVLRGHTSSVRAVAISNENIVSGSFNGEIFYWSLSQRIQLGKIINDSFPINSLNISTKGEFLIAGSNNSVLKIWSYVNGQVILKQKVDDVCYFNFLSTEYIAIGYKNGTVLIINIETKYQQRKHLNSCDSVTCLEPYFEKNTSKLTGIIIGTYSGKIMLGDLDKPDFNCSANINKIITAITSNGEIIVGGIDNGDLFMIPLNNFNSFIFPAHQSSITKCNFLKENQIVTVSKDCSFKIWLLEECQITQQFSLFNCHNDWIISCAYEDNILATCSQDCTIKLWNIETKENLKTLCGLNAPIKYVTLQDIYVIAGAIDGTIGVWTKFGDNITTISQTMNYRYRMEPAYILKKSNNGKMYQQLLASVDENNILTIRKPFTKPLLATLESHIGPIMSSCITPKDIVLSCSLDNTVKFWKLSNIDKDDCQLVKFHKGKITSVGFSPNRHIVFSCDVKGKLVIWSINWTEENYSLIYNTEKEWKMGSIISTVYSCAENKQILVSAITQDISVAEETTENKLKYFVTALHLTPHSILNEIESYHFNEEVSSMKAGTKNIAIGLKSGSIMITDNYLRSQRIIKISDNWIVNVAFSRSVSDELFIIETSGIISVMSCNSNNQETKIINNECNWPSAFIANDGKCYIGNNDGSLVISSENETHRYQIHADKINDLYICSNYLFSCSQDRIIKIWELNTMKQVGQFFFHLPVLVLVAKSLKSIKNTFPQISILCGTTNGEVHLLIWNS